MKSLKNFIAFWGSLVIAAMAEFTTQKPWIFYVWFGIAIIYLIGSIVRKDD